MSCIFELSGILVTLALQQSLKSMLRSAGVLMWLPLLQAISPSWLSSVG